MLRRTLSAMTEVHAVPDWVRPSAAEVFDLHWLAYRRYLDADHEVDAARTEAIAATVVWVWGGFNRSGDAAPGAAGHTGGRGRGDVGGDGDRRRGRYPGA